MSLSTLETPAETLVSTQELPAIGTYHSPADIEDADTELDAAAKTILSFVALIRPKVVTMSIEGLGYIDSERQCRDRLQQMTRAEVLKIADIIPPRQ